MGLKDEAESYVVGETKDATVRLVVRDRSQPEISSWVVEITTNGHSGQNSTLIGTTLAMPAGTATDLAHILLEAGALLAALIEGDADALPDEPPA